MAGRGRGRGRNLEDAFITMTGLMENMQHQAGLPEFQGLDKFRRNDPPKFSGGFNPEGAQKWLKDTEKIFKVMLCTEAQKVSFGTHMLVDEAEQWWENVTPRVESMNTDVTWEVFREAFLEKYFPMDVRFGVPTQHLVIRSLTCISPDSAMIALGSEMSGGIQDVKVEDVTAINTESAIRIKTVVGKGGYVKNIFVKGMNLDIVKYVFWMTGSYGSHPDPGYDSRALPYITGINYRNVVAKNVKYSVRLEGIFNDLFTGICISNVDIQVGALQKKFKWNCTNALPNKGTFDFPFPNNYLPIEYVQLKTCFL